MKANALTLGLLLIPIFAYLAVAQQKVCVIKAVQFDCPDNFKQVKSSDNTVRLFKYKESGNDLYFFATIPTTSFDPQKLGKAVKAYYSQSKEAFRWKRIPSPLVMSTKTKYKYDLSASYALSTDALIEIKGFVFKLDGKQVVLGYVSDWTGGDDDNRRRFERGTGVGDNAAGCNAVVTVLNSITHEFKEKNQYCFLTMLSAPK